MADLELTITILDLNVQKAAQAFLKKCPIPLIENPENPDEMIPKFSNTKAWVEGWLKTKLLRAIDAGITLEASDYAERLTKAIFKK